MTERISTKNNEVQESLKANVGKIIEVRGVLTGGDPINKLEGEALVRDIEFQRKQQHRKYVTKDPYIKFQVKEVKLALKDKDAAERLVYQMIYTNSDGQKSLTVETKSRFTIGYRSGDKLIPIKQSILAGKRFAYNQNITITYEVYQNKETEECGIGLANIIFDEKPKFFEYQNLTDRIGAVSGQNWAEEVDDLGLDDSNDSKPSKASSGSLESDGWSSIPDSVGEEPTDDSSTGSTDDGSDWGSVWN